jgi:hypothetical protein
MWIRDPGWKKFGSGIRDKHPGSATLPKCFALGVKKVWVLYSVRLGCLRSASENAEVSVRFLKNKNGLRVGKNMNALDRAVEFVWIRTFYESGFGSRSLLNPDSILIRIQTKVGF